MSDEDRFLEDEDGDGGDDVEVGKKVGFLPAIVIKILQIVAIAIASILLVTTVSVIVFNNMMSGRVSQGPEVQSPEYSDNKEKPEYFTNIKTIRGQTADNPPQTFFAEIVIGYEMENIAVQTELIDRTEKIQNLILKHLASKTTAELAPVNAENIEKELLQKINDIMVGKITEVLFTELQSF